MRHWIGDQMAGVGPEATRVFGRNAQIAVIRRRLGDGLQRVERDRPLLAAHWHGAEPRGCHAGREGDDRSSSAADTSTRQLASRHASSRIRRSRDIGASLGLVPRRYQSGEVDYVGGISKCGIGGCEPYCTRPPTSC